MSVGPGLEDYSSESDRGLFLPIFFLILIMSYYCTFIGADGIGGGGVGSLWIISDFIRSYLSPDCSFKGSLYLMMGRVAERVSGGGGGKFKGGGGERLSGGGGGRFNVGGGGRLERLGGGGNNPEFDICGGGGNSTEPASTPSPPNSSPFPTKILCLTSGVLGI